MNGLGTRIASSLVLIPVVMLLIWAPALRPFFYIFIAALAAIGAHEYFELTRHPGIRSINYLGTALAFCIALAGMTGELRHPAMALSGAFIVVSIDHVRRAEKNLSGWFASVFGLVYVAWLGAHMNLLQSSFERGPALLTTLLVAVALTDAGAYFSGKTLGKHKMAPLISPNKTWEGAVGGFVICLLGMAVIYKMSLDGSVWPGWTLPRYLVTGALISVVAQCGDLTESWLKRSAGVKDSGTLIPGHGGVLDRCDGFLFAAPLLYYIAHL